MKKVDGKNKASVWGLLVLCAGCVAFVFSKQSLFLMAGVLGFTLFYALSD